MTAHEANLARAGELLRLMVTLSGLSRRKVEKRLRSQGSRTSVVVLLRGKLQLKLGAILEIIDVIGVQPCEFFGTLFPPPPNAQPSAVMQILQAAMTSGRAAAAAGPRIEPELRHRTEELVHQFELLIREKDEHRRNLATPAATAKGGDGAASKRVANPRLPVWRPQRRRVR